MNATKVLKFGGACLATPEGVRRASAIVSQEIPGGGLVVVSALFGVTDLMLTAMTAAQAGDQARARKLLDSVRVRHAEMARGLELQGVLEPCWAPLWERLDALLEGISLVRELSPRTRDAVLSIGETLATHLLRERLVADGRPAIVVNATELIETDARHGHARPRPPAIERAAQPLLPLLAQGQVLLTQGFVGSAPDGSVTTLGRGGSDTTATLLGEALKVAEVQIWTETDGILTADPSLVPEARFIPQMSLAEIGALSAFGSKSLHADALAPVARAGFALVVANALSPTRRTEIHPGTGGSGAQAVTSVAYKEGLTCVHLGPDRDLETLLQVTSRLQECGALRYGLVESPEGALLAVRSELPETTAELRALRAEGFRVETGWAVVALVGEGLRSRPGHALALLANLEGERIGGLLAGGDGISAAVLLREDRLGDIIPRLHRICFGG